MIAGFWAIGNGRTRILNDRVRHDENVLIHTKARLMHLQTFVMKEDRMTTCRIICATTPQGEERMQALLRFTNCAV
jgi:hypothetical protein